jgi:hypothetical protein
VLGKSTRTPLSGNLPFHLYFPDTVPTLAQIIAHPRLMLDDRQALAFKIVATYFFGELAHDGYANMIPLEDRALLEQKGLPEQLIMHIPGKAGTGKSRVLLGLRVLAAAYDRAKWLLVCAPTGTAASNVRGVTIHALGSLHSKSEGSKALNRDLKLHPGRIVIIDEISMTGAGVLARFSEQLELTTGQKGASFGGKHVVMFGDFAQLAPVMDTALHSLKVPDADTGDKVRRGLAIWQTVNTVVALLKVHRTVDARYLELLDRLRWGDCTRADYAYLCIFVAGPAKGLPAPRRNKEGVQCER